MTYFEITTEAPLNTLPFLMVALVTLLGFFLTKPARMEPTIPESKREGLRHVMAHFPDLMDEVYLSKNYREILNHLNKNGEDGRTVLEVAEELGITTSIARGRLKHLFDKKYLNRKRAATLKPGVEFLYYPRSV